MKENMSLEEIFSTYQPELGDRDEYMKSLSRKLEAVELVKHYYEQQARRYKIAVIFALVLGIFIGGVGISLITMFPSELPIFTFGARHHLLVFLEEHSRSILLMLISLLMSMAFMGILNMWNEIKDSRQLACLGTKETKV